MPNPLHSQASIQSSRLYSRRPLDLRARLLARPDASGYEIVVHARTVDLSRSGAGLTLTGELLAAGTEVVLCLRPPGWKSALCLKAVITRRRGFRVGLAFVRPTAEQRLQLGELCYD